MAFGNSCLLSWQSPPVPHTALPEDRGELPARQPPEHHQDHILLLSTSAALGGYLVELEQDGSIVTRGEGCKSNHFSLLSSISPNKAFFFCF